MWSKKQNFIMENRVLRSCLLFKYLFLLGDLKRSVHNICFCWVLLSNTFSAIAQIPPCLIFQQEV